jgi:hypothetical protein
MGLHPIAIEQGIALQRVTGLVADERRTFVSVFSPHKRAFLTTERLVVERLTAGQTLLIMVLAG